MFGERHTALNPSCDWRENVAGTKGEFGKPEFAYCSTRVIVWVEQSSTAEYFDCNISVPKYNGWCNLAVVEKGEREAEIDIFTSSC